MQLAQSEHLFGFCECGSVDEGVHRVHQRVGHLFGKPRQSRSLPATGAAAVGHLDQGMPGCVCGATSAQRIPVTPSTMTPNREESHSGGTRWACSHRGQLALCFLPGARTPGTVAMFFLGWDVFLSCTSWLVLVASGDPQSSTNPKLLFASGVPRQQVAPERRR